MFQCLYLLRPHQWLKNVFVFAPIFFSNNIHIIKLLVPTIFVFGAFCFISSSIYCYNDIKDVEADRHHPLKKTRPIASGAVSVRTAYSLLLLCLLFSSFLLYCANGDSQLYLICVLYYLLNVVYCNYLKRYAIVDVIIIAVGFVLRVLAGGVAADIWVSEWLVLMTFLLALLMALTKRYDDFLVYEHTGAKPRVSITGYNKMFINGATAIIGAITMVCYIMYTMSEEVTNRFNSRYIYLTCVWVLAGLLRYLQKMLVYEQSSSPTKSLLMDRFVQICIIGWLFSFFVMIYL